MWVSLLKRWAYPPDASRRAGEFRNRKSRWAAPPWLYDDSEFILHCI